MPDDYVVANLNCRNASDSLHRNTMLQATHTNGSEIHYFCHMAYNFNSVIKFGDRQIISEEGAQ